MVVPERENENHAALEGAAHGGEATLALEAVRVAERSLLGIAVSVRDRVVRGESGDVGLRVLDDDAILDVDAADLDEVSRRRVVGGDELGDDGDLLVGVDGEARAEEALGALAERVEVASILVANSVVAFVTVTALSARAAILAVDGTYVRGHSSGIRVGLPDIHFIAASTITASS